MLRETTGEVAWHACRMRISTTFATFALVAACLCSGFACRVDELFDLDVNLRAAAHVFDAQGSGAWASS